MDEHYWMFVYKVAPCPAKQRHDWSSCPYAHRGERAARRCPRATNYSAEPCPEYSKRGTCPKGDTCPMAHSVFESWLHPSRFRTQLCCFGTSCRRRICFFAHDASQLRTAPTTSSSSITGNPPAPVMRRTQAVVPAVMMGMPNAQPGPALAPNPALAAAAMQQQVYSGAMASQSAAAAMAGTGWVLTGQGWAPMVDPGVAAAAAAAAAAGHPLMQTTSPTAAAPPGSMAASLAAGLDRLMLQDQLPATQPQQGQSAHTMLQPYFALSQAAAAGVAAGMAPGHLVMPAPISGLEGSSAGAVAAAATGVYGTGLPNMPTSLGLPQAEQQASSQLYHAQQGGWQ